MNDSSSFIQKIKNKITDDKRKRHNKAKKVLEITDNVYECINTLVQAV